MKTMLKRVLQPRLTRVRHDSWRYPVSVGILFATGLLLLVLASPV